MSTLFLLYLKTLQRMLAQVMNMKVRIKPRARLSSTEGGLFVALLIIIKSRLMLMCASVMFSVVELLVE